jgi:hypothetical protein
MGNNMRGILDIYMNNRSRHFGWHLYTRELLYLFLWRNSEQKSIWLDHKLGDFHSKGILRTDIRLDCKFQGLLRTYLLES